ncbi:MAG: GNAT family N-acetyltransferase [Candidatus Thermoplasmatota archaeon]|nr:GNAT family N-acetyltransferase [Candidatus Thermoplasmatota archaeon]MCL5789965.1 GNAT family N-acetyltransferase [Candidatus Thermoplasmatota archaeon]
MIANSGVVLKDGSLVVVREYRESDLDKLKDFVNSISDSSIQGRFMQSIPRERAIDLLISKGVVSIVAIREDRIIAHGALYQKEKGRSEMGILVDDRFQSQGLGTAMLGLMAEEAVRSGTGEITAYVAPENYKMISVVKNLGFAVEASAVPGALEVKFSPSLLPEAIRNFENRDARSAVNAVKIFLEPKSVAVIGASSDRKALGGQLFYNLLESNFKGQIFPVNPSHDFVQGIRAYRSVKDIEFPVDMALIIVPAEVSLKVIEECGQKGVKGLVIITSGFSEVGEEGKERQAQLTKICDKYGMRVIGPNCMGVVNTSDDVSLNAQFSPFKPVQGRIAFLSQSGALGIAVFDITTKLGLGLSSFVSVGNKMDISGNDLIQYWENDKNTDVILLYLESFGNPIKFSRLARRITKKKPIIVVKSGRGSAGFRATQSHTAALLSTSDVTVDALFKQSGIIRTDTLDEMFEVTSVLAHQPVPRGNRVAILTNAGGAGILAADACESHGLVVPDLSEDVKQKLRKILPSIASVRNPVDMTAGIGPETYRDALEILGSADEIDSIIVIFILPAVIDPANVAKNIIAGTKNTNNAKTVVSVFMGTKGVSDILKGDGVSIPSFTFPEDAAISLSKAVEYGKWKYAPPRESVEEDEIDKDSVKAIISKALRAGKEWLSYNECNFVLNTYKVPTIKTITAVDPQEVRARTAGWTGNVAIKAYGPKLVHKSDVGAVKLNVPVQEAPDEAGKMVAMLNSKGFDVDYLVVQEMVSEGIEMLAGSTHDPSFGPLIVAGMGGKLVELLKDISTRLAPIDRVDAGQMISELRTANILRGYRGGIVADEEAYKDVLVRISRLVYDNPEIVELDLNPVMVLEKGKGTKTVDFRIRVANVSHGSTPFVAKSVIKTPI